MKFFKDLILKALEQVLKERINMEYLNRLIISLGT